MKQKPIHPAMQPFLDGQMILIDKPFKWTSFDAVKKVRICTGVSKVGHAGTLDPLATGLLIICTGKFTKKINEYMGMPKEYTGTITIGATTPTFDLESEPQNVQSIDAITLDKLLQTTTQFLGNILQLPPKHSAIKKDGKPIYLAARKGEEVQLDPRPVTIHKFEITRFEGNEIDFIVQCTTGTYIRSLANDFGAALGVGGYLSALRRTKIGAFSVEDALSMDAFDAHTAALKKNFTG